MELLLPTTVRASLLEKVILVVEDICQFLVIIQKGTQVGGLRMF